MSAPIHQMPDENQSLSSTLPQCNSNLLDVESVNSDLNALQSKGITIEQFLSI